MLYLRLWDVKLPYLKLWDVELPYLRLWDDKLLFEQQFEFLQVQFPRAVLSLSRGLLKGIFQLLQSLNGDLLLNLDSG